MSDPIVTIPLQVPTASVKNAAALQSQLNGAPLLVEYVLPAHPLLTQQEWVTNTASTNFVLVAAPGVGIRTALTMLTAFLSLDATVNVPVRIGFCTAGLPAESMAPGCTAIPMNHQLAPGGGLVLGNGGSIICLGHPNFSLRITHGAPTGGKLVITAQYFQPQIT